MKKCCDICSKRDFCTNGKCEACNIFIYCINCKKEKVKIQNHRCLKCYRECLICKCGKRILNNKFSSCYNCHILDKQPIILDDIHESNSL